MKKTVLFVLCAVLLLSASIAASLSITANASYELQDIKGDSAVLKGIDISFVFGTPYYKIKVLASDGEVSHQLVRQAGYVYSDGVQISPQKEDPGDPISEWETKQIEGDPSYNVKCRTLGSVALHYNFFRYGKHMEIETGLRDHSNDQYTIYEEVQQWGDEIQSDASQGSILADIKDEQSTVYVPGNSTRYLVEKDQDTYYLMPDTSDYTTGINHIYQIDISEDNFGYQKLTALPEQRSYQELYLVKDHLMVISSHEGTLYFDKYELDGTLSGSWETTRALDVTYYQKAINDQYLIMRENGKALVLDTDQMKLVAEESLYQGEDQYISDMYYQNGIMYYVLVNHNQYNTMGISIIAIKDAEIVYDGTLAIIDNNKPIDQSMLDVQLNVVSFIRK